MNSKSADNRRPVHDLARLSYLQGLFIHRRALVVADDPALADFLLSQRARFVSTVFDGDPIVTWPGSSEGHGHEFTRTSLDDLRFRDGMFDIAIVPDITRITDAVAALNELRRVVGSKGVVVVGAPNPNCETRIGPEPGTNPLDYYVMYDLLADAFPSVQMVGQAPFVGYAVSDLSAGDEGEGVSFDAGLLEDGAEEIEWFMAVCSEEPVALDSYAIVQIPMGDVGVGGASAEELEQATEMATRLQEENARLLERARELGSAVESERTRLAEATGKLGRLTQMEEELRGVRLEMGTRGVRIETLEQDLEHERQEAEAARARAVKIAKQFDDERKAQQARKLEEEMARKGAEIDVHKKLREATGELRQAEARAVSAESSRDDLVERMRSEAAQIDSLRGELDDLESKLSGRDEREKELEARLSNAQEEAARAAEEAAKAAEAVEENASLREAVARDREIFEAEVKALEAQLAGVGADLKEAREELTRREALVRDLVVKLEGAVASQEQSEAHRSQLEKIFAVNAGLEARLAEMESRIAEESGALVERDQRIARLEGELQAASWKAEELVARSEDKERQIEEISAGLEARDGEVSRLTARVKILDDELKAALDAISGQHRARVDAELALATSEKRAEDVRGELDDFIERTRNLEDELAALMGARSGHHRARVEAELALVASQKRADDAERELSDLIERAREMEDQLAGLNEKLAKLEADLLSMKEEAQTERIKLSGEKKVLEEKIGEMEQELIEGRGRIRNLESDLSQAGAEVDKLAGADERVNALRLQLEEERRRVSGLEQELGGGRRNSQRLEDEVSALGETISRLRSQLDDATARVQGLEAENQEGAQRRATMEDQLSRLSEDLEGARGKLIGSEERVRELETEAGLTRAALEAAKDELAGARALVDEQARKLTLVEDEVRHQVSSELRDVGDLQGGIERLEAQRDQALDELRVAREKCDGLTSSLQKVRGDLDGEIERTRQAGADAARMSGEIEDLEHRLQARETALSERTLEMEASAGALGALRAELARSAAQVDSLRDSNRAEHVRTRSLMEEIKRLEEVEERVEASAETEDIHLKRIDQLEEQLSELRNLLDESKIEVSRVKSESGEVVTGLRTQVESLGESLSVSETQLKDFASQLLEVQRERDTLAETMAQQKEPGIEDELIRIQEELGRKQEEAEAARRDAESAHREAELAKNEATNRREELEKTQISLEETRTNLDRAREAANRKSSEEVSSTELAQLRLTAAKQAETIRRLSKEGKEREPLLESLTAQLEEREKRASTLERRVRAMEEQLKEHESDTAAWNMELKFRNSRISQLEEEVGRLTENISEARTSRPAPPPPPPQPSADLGNARKQIQELNDTIGDRDAQLLLLHGQNESTVRIMERTRKALQNLLASGSTESSVAIQLHDIVAAMEKK